MHTATAYRYMYDIHLSTSLCKNQAILPEFESGMSVAHGTEFNTYWWVSNYRNVHIYRKRRFPLYAANLSDHPGKGASDKIANNKTKTIQKMKIVACISSG